MRQILRNICEYRVINNMFWDAEILIFLLYFTENALTFKIPLKSPNSPKAKKSPNLRF
jgi:hypothetical protein